MCGCGCGCGRVSHVPHTVQMMATLDDVFFRHLANLSFHICLLFCWLLLQPATPVTHQEYYMLNLHHRAPIIQHRGSRNLASQAVVSALLVTVAAFVLIFGIDKVTDLWGGLGVRSFKDFQGVPKWDTSVMVF